MTSTNRIARKVIPRNVNGLDQERSTSRLLGEVAQADRKRDGYRARLDRGLVLDCERLCSVPPLLLTGPPAAGKSTTARDLGKMRERAAVIDVDDIRQVVISGHAAPWDGEEGRLQQRVGVENACDLAQRLHSVGIDVVIADVVADFA